MTVCTFFSNFKEYYALAPQHCNTDPQSNQTQAPKVFLKLPVLEPYLPENVLFNCFGVILM